MRERIARLVDPGSFHETGKIAGRARYDGQETSSTSPLELRLRAGPRGRRPVVVGGDDFTVRGGSADATIKAKHMSASRWLRSCGCR